MSPSKSKCWYPNNCLRLLKRAVPSGMLMPCSQTLDLGLFYKRYRLVIYGFCSKLMCLYKLVCLSLTIEKTLAFYKIYPFFENYESRIFYTSGPFIINYTPDLWLYQNKLVHFGIMHTMNGTTYFVKAISYARKMFMK